MWLWYRSWKKVSGVQVALAVPEALALRQARTPHEQFLQYPCTHVPCGVNKKPYTQQYNALLRLYNDPVPNTSNCCLGHHGLLPFASSVPCTCCFALSIFCPIPGFRYCTSTNFFSPPAAGKLLHSLTALALNRSTSGGSRSSLTYRTTLTSHAFINARCLCFSVSSSSSLPCPEPTL